MADSYEIAMANSYKIAHAILDAIILKAKDNGGHVTINELENLKDLFLDGFKEE